MDGIQRIRGGSQGMEFLIPGCLIPKPRGTIPSKRDIKWHELYGSGMEFQVWNSKDAVT